jgi:hypothetical protein
MVLQAINVLRVDAALSFAYPFKGSKTYDRIYTLPHIPASAFCTSPPQDVGDALMLAAIGHNNSPMDFGDFFDLVTDSPASAHEKLVKLVIARLAQ